MIQSPVLTGIGLISALGPTAEQTWEALLAGRFIANHTRISGLNPNGRCAQLAQTAAKSALNQAGWSQAICNNERTGLILATSKGPIEDWLISGPGICGLAQLTSDLARSLGISGPRITMSAACATGLHGLIRAALAIHAGEMDRALVVAAEASVHPLFVGSFQRLGVLAPEGHGCRPFDQHRQGFVMSEAAAAVCVEPREKCIGKPLVKLERFALGGEAESLTAGQPDGQTLRYLLQRTVGDRPVDFVHAHGTGTIVHDPIELRTLECISGRPILYSHKAALGHSLGAAGLVAVVINCLCHLKNQVPPNPRSPEPLPMNGMEFPHHPIKHSIERSIAIANGFGGAVAVVSLSTNI